MRKKQLANLIMVIVIVLIMCTGVILALHLRVEESDTLGSEFAVLSIPDDRLVNSENPEYTCTIEIRCDTILSNRNDLDPAKAPYVPPNGVILPATTVEFSEGETVFEVLQRVCSAADIQLEYSWTPLYDSYYVEGINQLYEFDCGPESGWMYKVDGWFPNYGCSAYTLTGGESIVWCYTSNGLGEDVGDSVDD